MNPSRVRELLNASPFRPFDLVTATRSHPVLHPDYLVRAEADPMTVFHVNQRSGEIALLDLGAEAARLKPRDSKGKGKA